MRYQSHEIKPLIKIYIPSEDVSTLICRQYPKYISSLTLQLITYPLNKTQRCKIFSSLKKAKTIKTLKVTDEYNCSSVCYSNIFNQHHRNITMFHNNIMDEQAEQPTLKTYKLIKKLPSMDVYKGFNISERTLKFLLHTKKVVYIKSDMITEAKFHQLDYFFRRQRVNMRLRQIVLTASKRDLAKGYVEAFLNILRKSSLEYNLKLNMDQSCENFEGLDNLANEALTELNLYQAGIRRVNLHLDSIKNFKNLICLILYGDLGGYTDIWTQIGRLEKLERLDIKLRDYTRTLPMISNDSDRLKTEVFDLLELPDTVKKLSIEFEFISLNNILNDHCGSLQSFLCEKVTKLKNLQLFKFKLESDDTALMLQELTDVIASSLKYKKTLKELIIIFSQPSYIVTDFDKHAAFDVSRFIKALDGVHYSLESLYISCLKAEIAEGMMTGLCSGNLKNINIYVLKKVLINTGLKRLITLSGGVSITNLELNFETDIEDECMNTLKELKNLKCLKMKISRELTSKLVICIIEILRKNFRSERASHLFFWLNL